MAWPLRWLSYTIDTVLFTAALMLVTIVHQYPFVHAWLTAKVLLLAVYIGLGSLALKRGSTRRVRVTCWVLALAVGAVTHSAFAADDPLQIVENLSDFIFSLIRAIGLILLGFGILQLGLSLKSHDPSQRANGMLTIAGGIVITFTREILTLITG